MMFKIKPNECPNCLSDITKEQRRSCRHCKTRKCTLCNCACQENKDARKKE